MAARHLCLAVLAFSLATPAVVRAADDDELVHEGFYLRLSVGPGAPIARVDTTEGKRTFAAVGTGVTFAAGTSLREGINVGLVGNAIVGGHQTVGGDSGQASSSALGLFGEWYPNPSRGLHVGGALALTSFEAGTGASGPGALGWLGHQFWIGDNWSLGLDAQAMLGLAVRRNEQTSRTFSGVPKGSLFGSALLAVSIVYQ